MSGRKLKFSAQGRKIFKDAVQTDKGDGKTTYSLGYPVAEVMEHIKNGDEIAKAIAEAMTAYPGFDS